MGVTRCGWAKRALAEHPECLWMRHPAAPLETSDDAALIVRRLRQYGSVKAWRLAGALERCLYDVRSDL